MIALAHKILRTLFFILKRRECYRDPATSHEALRVKRNAPLDQGLIRFGFLKPAIA